MDPILSISGLTHPCYVFYQRMIACAKKEEVYTRMCFNEFEDYIECKSRKKHRVFQNFVSGEMRKLRIYSLPKYDENTDTFVDGPLPKDADSYFSKDKALQQYYQ